MRFLWNKRLNTEEVHKDMFEVPGEHCTSRKAVYNWIQKFNNGRFTWMVAIFKTTKTLPREVTCWLWQQPETLFDAGFQGLVNRLDKCLNVQQDYIERI